MRIVQVSEEHLRRLAVASREDAARFLGAVDALDPGLIVHVAGAVAESSDAGYDRAVGIGLLSGVSAPLVVIPEDPLSCGQAVRRPFGHDRFLHAVGEWSVAGIDSSLLDADLPEAEEQWAWIETLPERTAGRPVLLFAHRPIWALRPELRGTRVLPAIDPLPRLERVLSSMDVRLFGSGQLHHYGLLWRDGVPLAAAAPTAVVRRSSVPVDADGFSATPLGVLDYRREAVAAAAGPAPGCRAQKPARSGAGLVGLLAA